MTKYVLYCIIFYGEFSPKGLPNKRIAVVPSKCRGFVSALAWVGASKLRLDAAIGDPHPSDVMLGGDIMEYFTVITLVIILLLIIEIKK